MAEVASKDEKSLSEWLLKIEPDDLVKFGLIPEFIGRLPVVAALNELTEESMMEILIKPKNALTKQYQALFKMDGIDLEFDKEALASIAKKALKQKTGARGLRSIMESILLTPMFEGPSKKGMKEFRVTKTLVEGAERTIISPSNEAPEELKSVGT
jgi:ATP-dependent Clp protease ATP-binding subunit ClpX